MAKRIVMVGLLGLVGVAGVVAARAVMFGSRQVEPVPIPEVALDLDAAVARLSQAVQFKTVSYQDPAESDSGAFEGLHAYLEEAFPLVHANLKKEKVNDWSLLYTWQGTDASLDPVVLLSHLDVVPVVPGTESGWDADAFSGAVQDGYIYGRGTLDDKVGVLAILEAVEMHLAAGHAPERTVILSFGHDEEVGGPFGAQAAAPLLQERGIHAHFVLDEGGAIVTGAMPGIDAPVATIGVAEKGYITVKLVVKAAGGHSMQPPRETAIGILSAAIVNLEKNQMPGGIGGLTAEMLGYLGPEMSFGMRAVMANLWLFSPLLESQLAASPVMNAFMRTTTAPTIFEAGSKEHVLPPKASATVNFRILPGDTRDDVVEHIKAVVNDDRVLVEADMDKAQEPSKISPSDGPVFEMIGRTVREVMPEAVVTPYLVLGGTDSRFYGALSDNVYRFLPITIDASDLKRIHGTNERIGVEAYGTAIRFYHRLIENAAL